MLQSIRALRGIAATLVVIYHACDYANSHGYPGSKNLFNIGAYGVDIFFVISGYVMLLSLEKKSGTTYTPYQTAKNFIARRIIRITPIYWIGTSILYFIYAIQPQRFRNFTASAEDYIASIFFFPTCRVSGGSTISPILSQGWTLYHEMFFYAIIFGTLLAARRVQLTTKIVPLGIVALSLTGAYFSYPNIPWIELITSPLNIEFAVGCAIYKTHQKFRPKQRSIQVGLTLVLAGLLLLLLSPDLSHSHRLDRVAWWGTAAGLVFYGSILADPLLQESSLFCKYVGDPSYSTYIFHGLTFSAADLVLKRIGFPEDQLAFISLIATISCITGYILFKKLENPINDKLTQAWKNHLGAPNEKNITN